MTITPAAKAGILLAITICGILPVASFLAVPQAHAMVRFTSYDELQQFILKQSRCQEQYGARDTLSGAPVPMSFGTQSYGAEVQSAATATVNAIPSHSETNNQVSGVDELDTVKNDGHYIYTVTNNTIAIVAAYPVATASLVSRILVSNQTIEGIFVDGDRLSIVTAPGQSYGTFTCGGATGIPMPSGGLAAGSPVYYCQGCSSHFYQEPKTSIIVYDLSDRTHPSIVGSTTVNGTFVGARRIGDMVYTISSSPAQYLQPLPMVLVNGKATEITATQVYHSDIQDQSFSYTTVLSLNIAQGTVSPDVQSFLLGTSSTIYVSSTNIFLTQPVWDSSMGTVIHRISIADSTVNYETSGMVPGHVLNQFSMDEFNGYFRVATSNDGWSSYSMTGVYVLDMSMQTVGRLEGLSPGEKLYAARFMGEKAYLVTFKRMDPLFVIDVSNPTKPSLLGQLEIPGVSDYLQPFDSTHLIGIGKSAQDVTWENAALFLGLKISLFDVSNPNKPSDLSDYTVGERGTDSPALTDQKAVLFDHDSGLLVIPILVAGEMYPANSSSTYYNQPTFQGAFVFKVTLDGGIVLRGTISHMPSGFVSTGTYYGYSSPLYVTRSLFIGNTLYTISPALIRMNSLADLSDQGPVILV